MKKKLSLISLLILVNFSLFFVFNQFSNYYEKIVRVEMTDPANYISYDLNSSGLSKESHYLDFIKMKLYDPLFLLTYHEGNQLLSLKEREYLKSFKFNKARDYRLDIIIRNNKLNHLLFIENHVLEILNNTLNSDLFINKYKYSHIYPNNEARYVNNFKINLLFFLLISLIEVYFIILFRRQINKFFKLR